jgi:hypothetical protein
MRRVLIPNFKANALLLLYPGIGGCILPAHQKNILWHSFAATLPFRCITTERKQKAESILL